MKLGIMQPYFFPYIGYWQLINAVDEYFIIDDVNYIKGGYINRNRILVNGEPFNFGIPIKKASQNKLINEHEHGISQEYVEKLLATLRSAYAKAPYFEDTYAHVKEVLEFGLKPDGINLGAFLENANRLTAKKLGIGTPIYLTSRDVQRDRDCKCEYIVVDICKKRGATDYYNAIGGTSLYSQHFFREYDLGLRFVQTNNFTYKQFTNKFVPNLSIIDIMMFCSEEQIAELLNEYTLVKGYESLDVQQVMAG